MQNAVSGACEAKSNKLFNFRPALFAAFYLVFGGAFAYFRIVYDASPLWLLALAPTFLLPLLFSESFSNALLRVEVALALFIVFSVGFLLFQNQVTSFQDARYVLGEVTVLGEVESCKKGEEQVRFVLKNLYIDEEKYEGRLQAYAPIYCAEHLKVGDKTLARGEIKTDLSLTGKHGFRGSEIGKRVYYQLTVTEKCVKAGASRDVFLATRARLGEVVYAGMDESSAALTMALLTGDVTGVDGDLMENMRYGGISHIFAVSGLNVGALFGFCLLLFKKTPLRKASKPLRFFLLLGVLFFYSGICGFSASVVRAAITCGVCYFTTLLGTGRDLLNALGIAAILILTISPVELVGVGFQLSFLACLGLFLLTKPTTQVFDEIAKAFKKRFPRRYSEEEKRVIERGDALPLSIGEEIWSKATGVLSASIAAQVATLPTLLYHFGYLSGWALLLNFFFVPIMDGLFILLLIVASVCCVLPTAVASTLLYVPSLFWSMATLVFESVDFSSFGLSGVQISLPLCVCYYWGTLFFSDKLNISKGLKAGLAVAVWLTFAVGLHLYNL